MGERLGYVPQTPGTIEEFYQEFTEACTLTYHERESFMPAFGWNWKEGKERVMTNKKFLCHHNVDKSSNEWN